ncbi:hypothetical protein SANA_17750 [Gottschalkiaceae bacterium SANA]|nr:hypothetical protein SANA_17750 [Gottschalkiaceae bacterium SANA]
MKRNRKNEEGAVLLLLIVMMSAVVLIVASLLRFNTQNIKFAAIEAEQEKALYLAEGIADTIDFCLLEDLSQNSEYDKAFIRTQLNHYRDAFISKDMKMIYDDSDDSDDRYLIFPSTENFLGETSINDVLMMIYDPVDLGEEDKDTAFNVVLDDNNTSDTSDDVYSVIVIIEVSGENAKRLISTRYEIPFAGDFEGITTLIKSKELNYSNSL